MFYFLDLTVYLLIVGVEVIVAPNHITSHHTHTYTHTHTHTVAKTSLVEGSVRRRDLYLTSHNTHRVQTSMLPAGFEPAIPASERPQTHVLDCAATGIGGCDSFS
jgi:hypothetical protein